MPVVTRIRFGEPAWAEAYDDIAPCYSSWEERSVMRHPCRTEA